MSVGARHLELAALVNAEDEHNEIACGAYLEFALSLLLRKTPLEIINVQREERSFFGSSDFVASGIFRRDTGGTEQVAYIWEVKAPQCNVMVPDGSRNRYAPSKDLYKAENQLLHYLHDASNSGPFRDRFGVGATGPVRAGGIIIGTDARFAPKGGQFDPVKAQESLTLRKRYLYANEQISVLTWDRIVEFLTPIEEKSHL